MRLLLVVAAAACGGVLDFLLGLVGLVLLRLQVGLNRQVRLRLTVGIGFGTSRRTAGHAVLPLVFRELPEAFADLGLEVVVHVLQILNGHGNLRTRGAIIPLAAGHEHFHILVCVWSVLDARQHIAGAQGTFGPVGCGFTENRRHDEGAVRGIERGRNFIGAGLASTRRGGATDWSGGFGIRSRLLLRCDLGSHFIGNLLLHLGRKTDGAATGGRLIQNAGEA